MNRMNPKHKFGIWLGMRSNSAACFIRDAYGAVRDHELEIGTSEQKIQRSHQERSWSTLEDDRRQMHSRQTRNSGGPDPNPSIAIWRNTNSEEKNHQAKHRRIRIHCSPCAAQSTTTKGRRVRIEECLRTTPQRAERLDRRSDDKTTAALPEPAAQDLRKSLIELDPNPKRRLLMKSASSTASGSGQQSAKRRGTNTESGTQVGATGESTTLPRASSANTRRRIVVKSEPAAVSTQGIDGYLVKDRLKVPRSHILRARWVLTWKNVGTEGSKSSIVRTWISRHAFDNTFYIISEPDVWRWISNFVLDC